MRKYTIVTYQEVNEDTFHLNLRSSIVYFCIRGTLFANGLSAICHHQTRKIKMRSVYAHLAKQTCDLREERCIFSISWGNRR